MDIEKNVSVYSLFSDFDINLFKSGKHYRLYEKLGAHTVEKEGKKGVYFAVWAPNAQSVSVIGNWNGWNPYSHPLYSRWDYSGIWEGLIFDVDLGELYKYSIVTPTGARLEKADPLAFSCEKPPQTASVVTTTWYEWKDQDWMEKRSQRNRLNSPFSVYELHLGSWQRDMEKPGSYLSYRQIAKRLVKYVREMGFTHVELMPVMEHPYHLSWGYQITGYYAASSRYGRPQDLMFLIDQLHQNDIGVILDWVPSHFPGDAHGLYRFDGTGLYEHEDPRQGFHPDWKSYIFNYGRNEVRSFLISNALFWLDRYHADGLRVDAVASMLYLDYSRDEGQWIPNPYGGRENLEAIRFLKEFNIAVYENYPDVQTIAEESTSFPKVSRPVYDGGLGFGIKWMMGWMHDTLNYFEEDPINRKYHHDKMTFATVYAFHENFMLPLSHDEVVHGKKSLIYKMPGDEWQKFANLRALYLFMYTFVGSKMVFMGGEFGQTNEWDVNRALDWPLLEYAPHRGLQTFFKSLNKLYKNEPALYEKAYDPEGFEWIEMGDWERSVFVFLRKGENPDNQLVVVLNLTPVVREEYRLGVPEAGEWKVILNADENEFFGAGTPVAEHVETEDIAWMDRKQSIAVTLPPLAGLVLKWTVPKKPKKPKSKKTSTTKKTSKKITAQKSRTRVTKPRRPGTKGADSKGEIPAKKSTLEKKGLVKKKTEKALQKPSEKKIRAKGSTKAKSTAEKKPRAKKAARKKQFRKNRR